MAELYGVTVKVKSKKGVCANGHKVGDEWVIKKKTPEGICTAAFNSFYSHFRVLRYGGSFPWEADPDVAHAACPDGDNPIIFELKRIRL